MCMFLHVFSKDTKIENSDLLNYPKGRELCVFVYVVVLCVGDSVCCSSSEFCLIKITWKYFKIYSSHQILSVPCGSPE